MQDENYNITNEPQVEYEELSSTDLMEKPFNPTKIDITTKPLTIDLLLKRLKAEPIEIDLHLLFREKEIYGMTKNKVN